MRYILIFISFSIFASSSLLDFKYIKDAKSAYLRGDYEGAKELYSKIEKDEAKFNLGDTLYREGKYKEAIEVFNSISDKNLEAKRLHNIGNSYAKLGEIDKAIKAYEDALKIKFDEDTKYNLDLLKKKKEEQKKEQKENNKQDENKKDSKDNKDSKNKNKDKKDNQNQNRKNQDNNETDRENKPTPTPDKEKEKGENKKQESKENNNTNAQNMATPPPISNMEERKWQRLLNKRGINSLMLEIDNKNKKRGENIDEINPW